MCHSVRRGISTVLNGLVLDGALGEEFEPGEYWLRPGVNY